MNPSSHNTDGVKTKIYRGKPIQWHFARHRFHVDCFRIETTCAKMQPLNKVKISLPVLLQNGCNDPTVGTAVLHKVNANKFTNTYTAHLDKYP
jgi:hypothetical protein